jgi:hypothetical protein
MTVYGQPPESKRPERPSYATLLPMRGETGAHPERKDSLSQSTGPGTFWVAGRGVRAVTSDHEDVALSRSSEVQHLQHLYHLHIRPDSQRYFTVERHARSGAITPSRRDTPSPSTRGRVPGAGCPLGVAWRGGGWGEGLLFYPANPQPATPPFIPLMKASARSALLPCSGASVGRKNQTSPAPWVRLSAIETASGLTSPML